MNQSTPFYVQALYAYSGLSTSSLSFHQGDLIEVLSTLESGWWDGIIVKEGVRGWFPSNYVRLVDVDEGSEEEEALDHQRSESSASYGNGNDRDSFRDSSLESNHRRQISSSNNNQRQQQQYQHQQQEDQEEDFWVPKILPSGQLFYYNPKTKETSRDIPISGQGDGIRIEFDDYSTDEDQEQQERDEGEGGDGEWISRRVEGSEEVYWENLRTGVRSWTPPPSSINTSFLDNRISTMSGWTAKVSTNTNDLNSTSTSSGSKRSSLNSDDSVLDGNFENTIIPSTNATKENSNGTELERSISKNLPPPPPLEIEILPQQNEPSTIQLLNSPQTPLISDLEKMIIKSLRDLVNEAGMGAMIRQTGSNGEERNFNEERNVLSNLTDNLVTSIRNLLLTSGVLDSTSINPDLNSIESILLPSNELQGFIPFQNQSFTLSSNEYEELKGVTRNLLIGLSKLLMPVRALWGTLESNPMDQVLDSNEISSQLSLNDESKLIKSEQQRKILEDWNEANEQRIEIEAKLRTQLLIESNELKGFVEVFISQYEDLLLSSISNRSNETGGVLVDRNSLRAPRSILGSFNFPSNSNNSTNKVLDQSFGGNWRGQGYTPLPSPPDSFSATSPTTSTNLAQAQVYTYPSILLTKSIAVSISQESQILVGMLSELKGVAGHLSPASSTRGREEGRSREGGKILGDKFGNQLVGLVTRLESCIAVFLERVEEVDIACCVDIEFQPSHSNSNFSSTQTQLQGGGPNDQLEKYKSSIEEASKFMLLFEGNKQSLYDGACELLFVVQEMFMDPLSSTATNGSNHSNGPQPSSNSPLTNYHLPLTSYSSSSSNNKDSTTKLLQVLSNLYSATTSISRTLTSLAVIADLQALLPITLRSPTSLATKVKPSPIVLPVPTLPLGNKSFNHSKSDSSSSKLSNSSSINTRREADEEEEGDSTGDDSVDSDFFFPSSSNSNNQNNRFRPNNPSSSSSSSIVRTRASSKAAQFFGTQVGSTPTNWGNEKRRSSNATSTSSINSDSFSMPSGGYRGRLGSDAENQSNHSSPTKSPSSQAKLAKLLGSDLPESKSGGSGVGGRSMSLSIKEPTPNWLLPDYGPDEVSFNMEGQIKGGTLKALVIAAASHEGRVDSNYLSAFLMTYRTFCTAHQLLDILIERFLTQPPPGLNESQMMSWETLKLRPVRARVANVIKSWVRDHMDHDPYDPALLHKIADFAATTMQDPVQSPQIIKAVEDRLQGAAPRSVGNLAPGSLPPSLVPRNIRKLKLIDIDPLEIARQLTIMDGRLFSRITPQECLGKAWPKEYGSEAPQITAMIAMSNAVTRWVTETILAQDDLKKRANTIKHFIYVAERCLALNNFSTLIHIIAGLNSTPVNRLRRTWETVSQKSMISLGILNNIMKQDKNYKEYREALRGVTPPCVPFLGVYLTDWTFIGDGNADMLREKPHQINFQKRQKATELILMIKLHQSTTYNLAPVPILVKWLTEQLYPANAGDAASDDQRLYEISLSREPRERDDEKIARLLSESGFL